MAFWSDSKLSEPLRQNRWYIEFGSLSSYQYALKSCSKPEYDIGVSEHVLLNHTFRYPKNLVWKPIAVKMIAVTEGNGDSKISLTNKLHNLLFPSGYIAPYIPAGEIGIDQNKMFTSSISKKQLTDTLQSIKLYQFDSNGKNIESWNLFNPFINNIKFGNLSYDNDGFVDIDLNIQYDYATLLDENRPNEEGFKSNNFTIFGLDTGINNFLEPQQKKDYTPGFPGPK